MSHDDALDLQHLRLDRPHDGVALVTLDLPERRNMMSAPMTASWARVMAHLRADRSVRVVVVTGAGKGFCSGGDVSWIGGEPDADVNRLRDRMLDFYGDWLAVRSLEVPVIAAVNGAAIGAGLALALACDLRVVGRDARLGVPFTGLGMHAGMATTWSLPDVVGIAAARDLLLTGRIVQGEEALALGLASRCVDTEDVLEESLGMARDIAARAPIATRLTTVALREGGHKDHATAVQWEALAQSVTLATEDLQEGLAAQRERRAPVFRGR